MATGFIIAAVALGAWSLDLKWALFSTLAVLFPFVLAVVKDVRRFLMWSLVFSIPLNIDYNFFLHPSVGGADAISLGLSDILLFFLMFKLFFDVARAKEPGMLSFFPTISLPTIAIIAASALSMLAARDLLWSAFDILSFAKAFLLFFVLANSIRGQKDVSLVVWALLLGLLTQAGLVAVQYFYGSEKLARFGLGEAAKLLAFEMQTANVSRVGGTIGHVNHLARYIGFLLPISIVLLLTGETKLQTRFAGVVSLAGGIVLIYTLTRSSWLALFVSTLVVLLMIFKNRIMTFRIMGKVALVSIAIVAVTFAFHDIIFGRLTTYDAGSAKTRWTTAKVAWHIFEDQPILGVGINNYGAVLEKYWDVEDSFTRRAAVHNTYLLYLSETGVVGFGAFLWLLFAFYISTRRAMKSRPKFFKSVAIGVMGSYAGFLIAALADKSYKENFSLLLIFWTLAALVEAINRLDEHYTEQFYYTLENEKDIWIPEKLQGSLESVY